GPHHRGARGNADRHPDGCDRRAVFLRDAVAPARAGFAMTAILEVQSVSMIVGGATLVDGIDLRIKAGETVAIVGPNGAGKSTLLRILSGDLRPTKGRIELKQREIHLYPPRQLAHHRAMLSQHVNVTFPFTVEEIVHMGAGDTGRAAAQ